MMHVADDTASVAVHSPPQSASCAAEGPSASGPSVPSCGYQHRRPQPLAAASKQSSPQAFRSQQRQVAGATSPSPLPADTTEVLKEGATSSAGKAMNSRDDGRQDRRESSTQQLGGCNDAGPSRQQNAALGGAEWYEGARSFLSTEPRWPDDKEKVVLAPYEYLASKPGKEVRGQLIEALNLWLSVPGEKIRNVHNVISMLHTSSLLIDDVEDASDLRRGYPTAHRVYGAPQTMNTANYVYFLVYSEVFAMSGVSASATLHSSLHQSATTDKPPGAGDPRLAKMLTEEMINLHRGQGMDLYWRDCFICPTEEEYVAMVNNKTGGLLRIMLRLMTGHSPLCQEQGFNEKDFLPLVNLIGLLFQIRDDYMNLRSGDYASNKGYCEDLTEGKFSFPVIHALSQGAESSINEGSALQGARPASSTSITQLPDSTLPPLATQLSEDATEMSRAPPIEDRDGLLAVLRAKPRNPDVKRTAVEYMQHATGSFRYTCDVMLRLDRLVRKEAREVEAKVGTEGQDNVRLWAILDALRKGWYGGSDCPPIDT